MSSKAKFYPVGFGAPGAREARESHVCVSGTLRHGSKQAEGQGGLVPRISLLGTAQSKRT